jgi:hypothetical protein
MSEPEPDGIQDMYKENLICLILSKLVGESKEKAGVELQRHNYNR